MNNLHLFNPGHETAVCFGKENYTPPSNVLKMMTDLSCLPLWYAEEGDFVLTETEECIGYLAKLPNELHPRVYPTDSNLLKSMGHFMPELKAAPWGLSPHSLHIFRSLQKECNISLDIPTWEAHYSTLFNRRTAAECLELIKSALPGYKLPDTPVFCSQLEEIEKYLSGKRNTYILKAPYSSSGRGLQWIQNARLSPNNYRWINGVLKKQQMVSIEPALDNKQDFAMEFYSDGAGNIQYLGVSVFGTAQRGAYEGNLLGSQTFLEETIGQITKQSCYTDIKDALTDSLKKKIAFAYKGYFGVDMLLYCPQSNNNFLQIHPCVEINFRTTMGIIALSLSKNLLAKNSTGNFNIRYYGKNNTALQCYQKYKERYPLNISKGKIVSGYLSLCPVKENTSYLANVLVQP